MFFFPSFVLFMDLFSHCIHFLYSLCCFYLLLFLLCLCFYLFYAYSIHFLCSSILVFVLLLICFSKNSIFFQKLTFQMSYDRFELFFSVKSSFEHGHGLPRSLSLLLLRFFPFFDFYFRITLSIYVLYKKQFLVVAINCLFFTMFFFPSFVLFMDLFSHCIHFLYSLCCFYLLLFLLCLCFYLFYAYSIHFLCSSILVFVLLLICFSRNSIFFQKLTFQMSYDCSELFFDVKACYMHSHVLPRSLSLLLLLFFSFFYFCFQITLSIYSII